MITLKPGAQVLDGKITLPVDLANSSLPSMPISESSSRASSGLTERTQDPRGLQAVRKCVEIIHLKQMHAVPSLSGMDIFRRTEFVHAVVSSQLEVCKFLSANKDAVVVLEGLTESLGPEKRKELLAEKVNMVHAAAMIFPKGVPENSRDLNSLQREFLYKEGGVCTLYYLGQIERIERSANPVEANDILDEIVTLGHEKHGPSWGRMIEKDPEMRQAVFDRRETMATAEIKRLISSGENKVIVVYGAGHNFARHYEKRQNIKFRSVDTVDLARKNAVPEVDPFREISDDARMEPIDYCHSSLVDVTELDLKKILSGITRETLKVEARIAEVPKLASFKGDLELALLTYGNIDRSDPRTHVLVAKEEIALLKLLDQEGIKIGARLWLSFVTPSLKIEALKVVDPFSVGASGDPFSSLSCETFVGMLNQYQSLKRAGEAWMKSNDI